MSGKKLAARLGDYFARFGAGREDRISREDIDKVAAKLSARCARLEAEITARPGEALRLRAKLDVARTLQARAAWLRAQIAAEAAPENPQQMMPADPELSVPAPSVVDAAALDRSDPTLSEDAPDGVGPPLRLEPAQKA
ncbi:MAG: hypothetical protein ACXIU7_14635 [Roseinatronobacter sp.]